MIFTLNDIYDFYDLKKTVINVTPKSIFFLYSDMKMTPLHDDLFLNSEYSLKPISTLNILIIIYGNDW